MKACGTNCLKGSRYQLKCSFEKNIWGLAGYDWSIEIGLGTLRKEVTVQYKGSILIEI